MLIPSRILKASIAVTVLFTFTFASSQEQPVQKSAYIEKSEDGKKHSAAEGQRAKAANQPSTPQIPALVTKVPANIEQPITDRQPSGADKNEHKEESGWAKIFTDPMTFFTLVLAIATGGLWWATRKLVLGAEDTARRQLRAYVSVRLDGNMFYGKDGLLNAPFITKNNGSTPAHGMICSVNIGLFRFPLNVELDPPAYSKTSSNFVLFPGEDVRQYGILSSQLNQPEVEAIKNGEGAIYVWGEVRYTDSFKQQHSTQFRMYSAGNDFSRGELAYHHEGNNAD